MTNLSKTRIQTGNGYVKFRWTSVSAATTYHIPKLLHCYYPQKAHCSRVTRF